jgi:hypothetical protein
MRALFNIFMHPFARSGSCYSVESGHDVGEGGGSQ